MTHIVMGAGTSLERKVPVKDFYRFSLGDRTAQIGSCEGDIYFIHIINSPDSGREPQQYMILSKESFSLMMTLVSAYLVHKDIDVLGVLGEGNVSIEHSESLPFPFTETYK